MTWSSRWLRLEGFPEPCCLNENEALTPVQVYDGDHENLVLACVCGAVWIPGWPPRRIR